MNRQAFIDRLRLGLSGLPAAAINEAVADYEAHFAEGAAAGRTEEEVAAALRSSLRHSLLPRRSPPSRNRSR